MTKFVGVFNPIRITCNAMRFKEFMPIGNRCVHKGLEANSDVRTFIVENTEIVGEQNLTPEIKLRLFTPNCRFWHERPERWPFSDPFWAIYWPGGQALARYLLDQPAVSRGRRVLDLGCGCGASAIAAKLSGAAHVVANDTDPVAAIATQMNCELNGLEAPVCGTENLIGSEPLVCVTENLIGSEPGGYDLILLGDMFYEEALANSLHSWLDRCVRTHRSQVLIGDPGRASFEGHHIKRLLRPLAQFELPESVREENYGLTCSTVWCYQPPV